MFTRSLPLAGESAYDGVPKLVVNSVLTGGLALTRHIAEVYLTRHLNSPSIISHPALKEAVGFTHHHHRGHSTTPFKRHHHGLDEKLFRRIALPASTTIKHACSASYVFQPPSTKASMVSVVLCAAVAIITASAVFLNSNPRGVSGNGSSTSSTSPSSSNAPSTQSSFSPARRVMLATGSGGSGGNNPTRGRDSGRRSSRPREHQPSPLRRTLATAESDPPPPPPPPHFPPPAEDDDKNPYGLLGFSIDWISVFLLVPIVVQLGKLFFSRRAQLSEDDRLVASVDVGQGDLDGIIADTSDLNNSDPTCDDILSLPAAEAGVLPVSKLTKTNDGAYACQNVLPLTTSEAELTPPKYHPSQLPRLAAGGSSASDSKGIEETKAGRLLRLWATVAFMMEAFVLSILPLMFFYLAGRQLELFPELGQRTPMVNVDSSEEGEVCEMLLERPEVRPVEDQVLASIANHCRPLGDGDMDPEPEPESNNVVHSPTQPKMQPSINRPSANIMGLPSTKNALNPQANTFVPKKSWTTHAERLARWKAGQFPQPHPQVVLSPAQAAGSSSQIPQPTYTAERLPQSSVNRWPQPLTGQTPGSSSQVHRLTESTRIEETHTKCTLTPNQKSNLRRRMRRNVKKEEEREIQNVVGA